MCCASLLEAVTASRADRRDCGLRLLTLPTARTADLNIGGPRYQISALTLLAVRGVILQPGTAHIANTAMSAQPSASFAGQSQASPIPPVRIKVSFRHGGCGVDVDECLSKLATVFPPTEFRPEFVGGPCALHERVCKERLAFQIRDGLDVDVMVGNEPLHICLGAAGCLAKVEAKIHSALQPGIVSKTAGCPVVGMGIDQPQPDHHIRLLRN